MRKCFYEKLKTNALLSKKKSQIEWNKFKHLFRDIEKQPITALCFFVYSFLNKQYLIIHIVRIVYFSGVKWQSARVFCKLPFSVNCFCFVPD